jgi:hypothetical protein
VMNVSTNTLYRFFLSASEGARFFIGDRLIVDTGAPNSSLLTRSASVGLRAGYHPFRLEYYERYDRAGLALTWTSRTASSIIFLRGTICDSIDFNQDGLFPDTQDISDFLSVFAGGDCAAPNPPDCNNDIDYNNDGLFPDTRDIDALLSAFSGGPCL